MSRVGIFIVATALGEPVGKWLADFEPTANAGRYPTGAASFADGPEGALSFPSSEEALVYWRQEVPDPPRRPDGKPNRPLTSFTVAIEPIPGGDA